MQPVAKQHSRRAAACGVPRVVSAPQLAGAGLDTAAAQPDRRLECWVYNRTFKTWCNGIMDKLPPPLQVAAKDCGVCHFLLAVKDPVSNVYHSFDFGPVGGDITLKSVEMVSSSDQAEGELSGKVIGAPGEIREVLLHSLPPDAMYVGSSMHWDVDAIRRHNLQQPTHYKLHDNDCRHYVNNLVRQMTGLEMATVQLLRHNFQQRVRAEQQARLHAMVGTLQLLAAQAQQLQQQTKAATLTIEQGTAHHTHHNATATLTLSNLHVESSGHAPPASAQAHAGATGLHTAAPLLLHLLAGLPTWDAPFVTLGQVITHPNNWPAVSSIGRAVMMGAGGVLAVKVVAATASAAAVAAPAAAAAHAVAVTAAPTLFPRTAAAAGRMSGIVAGKLSSFAPAARALAAQLKSRAAQVAAPLVAMAHAHNGKQQLRLQRKLSNGTITSVMEPPATTAMSSASVGHATPAAAKRGPLGGLLPLPLRLPHAAPATSLMSSSRALVPSTMLDRSAPEKAAEPDRVGASRHRAGALVPPARMSFWPLFKPRHKRPTSATPPPSPALLPTATLQAAVMPQGPASPPTALTRPRLVPAFSRFGKQRSPAATGHFVRLTWAAATHPSGLFRFACTPLTTWLASKKSPAGRPTNTVLVPTCAAATAVVPVSSATTPPARMWGWSAPPRPLPLPSDKLLNLSDKDPEQKRATWEQAVAPLEPAPSAQLPAANASGTAHTAGAKMLSPNEATQTGAACGSTAKHAQRASDSIMQPVSAVHDQDTCTSCLGNSTAVDDHAVAVQPLLHMPALPDPSSRRKPLFGRSLPVADNNRSKPRRGLFGVRKARAAASSSTSSSAAGAQSNSRLQQQSTSPVAGMLAVLVTHMVQGQFQNTLL